MTAFANTKHDDPKQTAVTLTFVRRLWAIVHEVFFNPLSANTLLADFSADLIQTLAQRPPDLSRKVVRGAWVTLLAEVLSSGTLDSTETLCDVLPESLWGSVYAGVVSKYAEEPNFEGGLVLCGVPFKYVFLEFGQYFMLNSLLAKPMLGLCPRTIGLPGQTWLTLLLSAKGSRCLLIC